MLGCMCKLLTNFVKNFRSNIKQSADPNNV